MSRRFDSLTAARELEAAGMDRKKAEAIADVVRESKEKMSGTFDTLTAARKLEAAGIDRKQAEAMADVMRARQGCAD